MNSNKTFNVLVLFSQTTKASNDALAGILRYASTRGDWRLWLFDPLSDKYCGSVLPPQRADGIISGESISLLPESVLPGLRRAVVTVSGENLRSGSSSVLCNHSEVSAAAARFFLKRGFAHFAFVESPKRETFSRDRLDAFAAAVRGKGRTFSHAAVNEPGFAAWLKQLPKPCAVFAANDRFAMTTSDHCRTIGIHVPDEIAILGVDDEEMVCNFTSPTLSSIRPAFELGGYTAAKTLDEIMRGTLRRTVHLQYGVDGIVERASTAVSAAGISSPAAVEEFIRLHATANISTNDAARAAGGDIARIKRAYRATYGYSICRGIQEARLREVQRLLRRTQMPIDGIAEMCGFGNGLYLKTLFRSRFGMTMRDYRKAAVCPDAPTPSLP